MEDSHLYHQSRVVMKNTSCWSVVVRSSVPDGVTLTYPPTLLMLNFLSLSFMMTEDAMLINYYRSDYVECGSEVAGTSTKWARRWCNNCYSAPCEACLGLQRGSDLSGTLILKRLL